ncbi:hypothetical protein BC834DRAFT_839720 [Gloeopeniophorella convolvens]|nr:hypothetical protein BC834DRAFT_839720 [Gloeopeniophorella convolvens]
MASDNQGWVSSPGRPNSSASISQPRGAPENPGRSTHIELDVIRASGLLPIVALDKLFGHRRFYITITDGTITKRTKAVESESQMVIWGETFNDYMITTSSQVTLKLFASRVSHQDSLVGTLVLLSGSLLASGSRNFDFALTGDTAMQPAPRVILRLAVTVVSEARPPAESTYPAPTISSHDSVPSKVEVVPVGSASAASPRLETIPIVETPSVVKALPQPDLAITDEAVRQIGLAPGKAIEVAEYIDRAPSAVDQAMDLWDTWSAALERIDWIVTVCAEVAEVHPYAKMAWSVLSFIPQALLNQVKRDDNVRALAVAMHNAFDFIHEASVFEEKILKSAQKTILVAMFTHTCACGDFIQSYAKDTKFRTRLLKNVYRGVDAQIEGYCSKLTTLREAFLNHAMVTIEKTAFQIQSDVGAVSIKIDRMTSRLDGISGQLESAMSEVSDSST